MSVVSIQRCARYEAALVTEALDRLLAPFGGFGGASGFGRRIRSGDRVLIKPNFLRAAPAGAAVSPHPELLRAICVRLLDLGVQLRIGDSPAFGTARDVARANGALDVAKDLDIPVVEFRKPVPVQTEGDVQLKLQIDREVIESDAVINLCKFKGHQQLGMTLAVKNLFGCITGKRKPIWHLRLGDRGNGFGEMLVEVYRHVAPTISICDGILAMQGDGPGRGEPRQLGVLLAAEDGVALDAVGAAIVGYPADQLRVLQAAERLGLGCPDLSHIELAGDMSLEELRIEDWKFPDSLPIFFNPGRVAWSTAKQALLLAKMRRTGT